MFARRAKLHQVSIVRSVERCVESARNSIGKPGRSDDHDIADEIHGNVSGAAAKTKIRAPQVLTRWAELYHETVEWAVEI